MRNLALFLLSTSVLFVPAAHGANKQAPAPVHAPIVYPFACSPGSSTFVNSHGRPGLVLKNANHSYECNGQNGTAGCSLLFGRSAAEVPFQNLSFTLTGGTNGTLNIYVDSKQFGVATYSFPFTSVQGTSIKLLPSQFDPPFPAGTNVFELTFDANPCQQVTISNIAVNGAAATISLDQPNCVCVGQPPN